jgi:predicted DNA binding CopG/RHH family protein
MGKQKSRRKSKIPPIPDTFNSISEAASFWDNHDSADYEDVMSEVEFDVDISRHIYLVSIAGNVLNALKKKAKSEGISTQTLVNLLLQKHAS